MADSAHIAQFTEIVQSAYLGEDHLRDAAHWIPLLIKVTDEELILLAQARSVANMSVYQEAIAAEVARRTTAALVAFKDQSKIASDRLEGLTRWLIAFTVVLAFLTVVIVAHDLMR